MKRVFISAAIALLLPAAANAKFQLALTLSDPNPVVGEALRVVVSADVAPAEVGTLRLVAVPPGVDLYAALSEEHSYGVKLVERSDRWTAELSFDRAGRWQLVVPNWGAPGYALPPPVVQAVNVAPAETAETAPLVALGTAVAGACALLLIALRRRSKQGVAPVH